MGKINKCKKCGSEPILNINDSGRQNGYSIRWAFVECEKCKEKHKNIVAKDDDMNMIIEISKNG